MLKDRGPEIVDVPVIGEEPIVVSMLGFRVTKDESRNGRYRSLSSISPVKW